MDMVSWLALKELFMRSHTWRLLESYTSEYALPTAKKMDFVLLAKVQDDFDHLCEVFEQDVRLGPTNETVLYCKEQDVRSVLRSSVWLLLKDKDDAASLLAIKAIIVSDDEKARADNW
jgi:hypothetical protein